MKWIHSNMDFKKMQCVEWISFAVFTVMLMMTKQTLLVAISMWIILRRKVLAMFIAL